MLCTSFESYFSYGELQTCDNWILNPFRQNLEDIDDDSNIKELINLRHNRGTQMEFTNGQLEHFWASQLEAYPVLAKNALKVLVMDGITRNAPSLSVDDRKKLRFILHGMKLKTSVFCDILSQDLAEAKDKDANELLQIIEDMQNQRQPPVQGIKTRTGMHSKGPSYDLVHYHHWKGSLPNVVSSFQPLDDEEYMSHPLSVLQASGNLQPSKEPIRLIDLQRAFPEALQSACQEIQEESGRHLTKVGNQKSEHGDVKEISLDELDDLDLGDLNCNLLRQLAEQHYRKFAPKEDGAGSKALPKITLPSKQRIPTKKHEGTWPPEDGQLQTPSTRHPNMPQSMLYVENMPTPSMQDTVKHSNASTPNTLTEQRHRPSGMCSYFTITPEDTSSTTRRSRMPHYPASWLEGLPLPGTGNNTPGRKSKDTDAHETRFKIPETVLSGA
ncbi:hypothetical protein O3P69_005260 [Scylla paramamosain]|uniref:Uncharacterized protein n=1 Tax=Scylla paramamosain TaxID=85552 RepID=A0AAW0U7H6_SCYPA